MYSQSSRFIGGRGEEYRWLADSVLSCREGGPTIFAQVKNGKGVEHIVDLVLSAWRSCGASAVSEANGTK